MSARYTPQYPYRYALFTVDSVINVKTGQVMLCRLEVGLEIGRKEINGMYTAGAHRHFSAVNHGTFIT
jgi:hypothetical protein